MQIQATLVVFGLATCLSFAAADYTPYVLGPGDQVLIRALDVDELSEKPFSIDSTGVLSLPLAGKFNAAGMTTQQLEIEVAARLKPYYWNPRVVVTVAEYRSQPVSVIGAVNTPGIQQLRGDKKRLVEVLSLAGGVRPDAGFQVTVQRKADNGPIAVPGCHLDDTRQYYLAEINLTQILDNRHPEQNIELKAHDVVSVARGQLVYVVGEVRKPGGFVLHDKERMTVLQALAMAEGALPSAAPASARILRPQSGKREKAELAVDVKRILSGKAKDAELLPDDVLFLPSSAGRKVALRSLEAAIQMGTGIAIWRR